MQSLIFFLIGRGVALGFSAASMPGPFQGYLINTSLKHGWRRSLFVVVSPLIVDIPIILVVLVALSAMEAVLPVVVDAIRILGGLFVLYLAWNAFQDFRQGVTLEDETAPTVEDTIQGTLLRAMLVNLLSPGPYLFWTTVNGPLLKQGLDQSIGHGIAFLIAFYGTFLSLLIILAIVIDWLRTLDDRLTQGILLLTSLILAVMGIWLLYDGISAFLTT